MFARPCTAGRHHWRRRCPGPSPRWSARRRSTPPGRAARGARIRRPARPGIVVLTASREVLRDGNRVELTKIEFDLFVFLARNTIRVWRRDELLKLIWQDATERPSRTVDVHVHRLRAKLGRDVLLTIHRIGYRLNIGAPVTVVDGVEEPSAVD